MQTRLLVTFFDYSASHHFPADLYQRVGNSSSTENVHFHLLMENPLYYDEVCLAMGVVAYDSYLPMNEIWKVNSLCHYVQNAFLAYHWSAHQIH